MSRRKQAKPRALKRGDWDSESLDVHDMIPDDAQSDTSCTGPTGGPGEESTLPRESDDVDHLDQSGKYRCETCGVCVVSLRSFMDHRNFECMAGMDEAAAAMLVSTPSAVAMETENSLESDLNGTDPPSWRSDTPDDQSLSPSSCATPTDPDVELSCTIGVTETTPYACQFCEKAFPRLSYLKRHEQSHGDQMPFKCDFCQRLFKHKRSRDRHVKLHTGDKKYRCPHCEAAFSRSDHLKIHMKTHDNAKPFQCTTCNRGYNTAAALTSHMQTHILGHSSDPSQLDKVAQCVYCPQVCVGFEALATHMDSVHPGEKQSKCPICGEATPTLELLYQHVKIHDEIGLSTESEAPPAKETPTSTYACIYCTKNNFINEETLQLHVQAMHGTLLNGELQAMAPSPTNMASAISVVPFAHQTALSFSCEYCTMKFATVHALQKHTLSVHSFTEVIGKGKEFVFCSQCTMGFTSSSALNEHIKLVHAIGSIECPGGRGSGGGIENVPSCSGGGSSTNTSNNGSGTSSMGGSIAHTGSVLSPKSSPSLEKNLKSQTAMSGNKSSSSTPNKTSTNDMKINGDIAPFTHPGTLLCNQCNAAFPDFESFRTHLKTHLDEVIQKFVCNECQGEFASEDQLDGHVITHYLSTTTEYGCQCCLKLFSKPDELQKHLMDIHAHHLYRCSLCKEMFDSKVSIQVHFAVKHSNECKLFKCTSCNSIFRSEMEFQLHVKVSHLRQAKPFRCLFCNLSFATELELQCHLMSHKKQFACTLCDEAFHIEFLLDKHMQTKHSTETPPEAETASTADAASAGKGSKAKSTPVHSVASAAAGKKEVKCDICDADLPTENALMTHRKQVHNIKASGGQKASQRALSLYCAYCNEACKSRTELENHMKVHTLSSSKHKCNVCDEVCPTASILAEHKLTHCKVITGSLCVVCKVNLKSEDQYYSHLQQHNAQGLPLPCVVCRQTLMSEIEVQMHAKFHLKNAEPLYPCFLCLKQFELNNLIVNGVNGSGIQNYVCKECFHKNTVGASSPPASEELRCSDCKVKFESEGDLEKHQLIHKKTYQCIKCQKSFDTENEIQLHVASHMLNEGTNHECKLCHKVFDSPAKLQCHLIEHTFEGCTSYTCYMCSAVFVSANLIQQHMLEHGLNSRPYDCSHCHQKFFFRAELENHVFTHVELSLAAMITSGSSTPMGVGGVAGPCLDNELECPECQRTFSSIMNLTNHRKIHQQKVNSYKCSSCPDVFDSSVEMQQHYFKAHGTSDPHSPKKSFRCAECDKEFPCLSNLQGHMRIHTHGTKFTCPECSKEFALSRNLNIHMRLHSGEKPYECPTCKKRFARKENRKAHLKSHSGVKPFMCPHCGKTFSRKCHVREHMRLHAGTPFACELCPEAMASSKQLHEHMLEIHHQELEHACKFCDERFGMLKNLKKHVRRVHSDVLLDSGNGSASTEGSRNGGGLSNLSSPEHSSCSTDLKDPETSECSSLVESEPSPGGSPFVADERNNATPQELMACE